MIDFLRKYWYFVLCAVCVVVLGVVFMWDSGEVTTPPPSGGGMITSLPEPPQTQYIQVHIVGAVVSPGVFAVPTGSRINDVLAMAGGATDDADIHSPSVNLSAVVSDGQQVIIPWLEGSTPNNALVITLPTSITGICPTTGLININFATLAQLQTLPGVGTVRAQNIISHRENHGTFTSIEQLLQVSQIGAGTLNGIRNYITV